jgi:hypothetical protein
MLTLANDALDMVKQFEKKVKAVVQKFDGICNELNKEPLLPADVCQEVAREVAIAAGKAAFDVLNNMGQ